MKRIFSISLLSAMVLGAMAQQKADLIVSYDQTTVNWKTDSTKTIKMSMLVNTQQSKYFDEVAQWTDSLESTPDGKRQYQEILMATCVEKLPDGSMSVDLTKGPVAKSHTYVFNNLPEGALTFYDKFATDNGFYSEEADEMKWEIGDSTTNILGYECNMATTLYHGRRWTAWFAPELPMPFGPWKLRGLPGLILKAMSDNGASFVAHGLSRTDRLITPVYKMEQYDKVDRKKALADHEYYLNHPETAISAKTGGRVVFKTKDVKKAYDAQKYALEPDYTTCTD